MTFIEAMKSGFAFKRPHHNTLCFPSYRNGAISFPKMLVETHDLDATDWETLDGIKCEHQDVSIESRGKIKHFVCEICGSYLKPICWETA